MVIQMYKKVTVQSQMYDSEPLQRFRHLRCVQESGDLSALYDDKIPVIELQQVSIFDSSVLFCNP